MRGVEAASQDGSVSLLAIAVAGVLLVAAGLVTMTGLAAASRHHLAAAADAAALAAAARADAGAGTACAEAGVVARHNGVSVVGCHVSGAVVTVALRQQSTGPLGWLGALTLNSRAGPADNYGTSRASRTGVVTYGPGSR
jgi:secretion/DNA translocation related TadE-like protein